MYLFSKGGISNKHISIWFYSSILIDPADQKVTLLKGLKARLTQTSISAGLVPLWWLFPIRCYMVMGMVIYTGEIKLNENEYYNKWKTEISKETPTLWKFIFLGGGGGVKINFLVLETCWNMKCS